MFLTNLIIMKATVMTEEKKERKKTDSWKKQQRDARGLFLSFDVTKNPKFTLKDIRAAYMAGLNDHGGISPPSKKVEMFLKKNGYIT